VDVSKGIISLSWLLVVVFLLSGCGSSGEAAALPVEPDPDRPTFILFFTDP
jgi:hypothetical protein